MRICKDHWAKIRERITLLGIDHLGAKSGQEAMEQMTDQIEGRDDPKQYDPLMDCNWMIFNHALELAGLQIMTQKEDGSARCPICEAWEHRHDGALPDDPEVTVEMFENHWINGPTRAAFAHCRNLGLVPKI